MTPDFKVTTIRQFPYPNNYDVYENSSGDVWVLCSAGIYSVPGDELLANAEIDPVFFSIQSGIPYVVSANSSSELTPDGRLYISGSEGVFSANVDDPFSEKLHYRVSVPLRLRLGKHHNEPQQAQTRGLHEPEDRQLSLYHYGAGSREPYGTDCPFQYC